MYIKRTLYLLLLLFSFRAGAQVSITAQLPSAGVLMKAQLWNVVLVSASSSPISVRIVMRLMDAATNQPLLTGITNAVIMSKGARQLHAGDFMPIQYEYLNPDIDRSVNGMLPAGNYLACYSLIYSYDKTSGQPGEDSIPFSIEPVSPPLLNTPANQSLLETALPQFTWLPPAPLTMFSDLNYDLIVTEIRSGQSANEAVQQNIPVFRAPRLKNIFVNYPSAAPKLDTAKQYAWTVTARNGNLFAAQTEVWTFRIKEVKRPGDITGAYVQLRKELDGTVISCNETIQAGYNNDAGDTNVSYEVLSLDNQYRSVYKGTLALQRGGNQLDIPLGKRKGLNGGKIYLFRLLNSRNEYWQLKFICTKEK